jgi:soluble lytic murein transglycosylase
MNKTKVLKTSVIVLIVIVSLIVGILSDTIFTFVEKIIYPEDYSDLVIKYADEYGIPRELVFAIIKVESNFDRTTVSSVGAMGLMQMMPSTYEWLTSKLDEPFYADDLFVPEVSIKYGTYYLQYLRTRFDSWEKVIIAYNWGEGNFMRFMEENGYTEGDYNSIPVTETRNYIKKVLHHWEKYEKLYN